MTKDDREQAAHLFATATAKLEDAIEVAVAGQSPKAKPAELGLRARELERLARDLAVLAEAARIIAAPSPSPHKKRR